MSLWKQQRCTSNKTLHKFYSKNSFYWFQVWKFRLFKKYKKENGKRSKKKANPQKNVLLFLVEVTRKTFNSYLVIKTFRSNFSLYGIREFFVDVPQPYDVFSDSFVAKSHISNHIRPHIMWFCDWNTISSWMHFPFFPLFFYHCREIVTVSTYILFEFFFIQFTVHIFYFVNFISHVWPILTRRKIFVIRFHVTKCIYHTVSISTGRWTIYVYSRSINVKRQK